jgi:hypothetical protein
MLFFLPQQGKTRNSRNPARFGLFSVRDIDYDRHRLHTATGLGGVLK